MRDNEILVKNWMDKAHEAIIDTKICIDNERYATAQNRLYYSICYAVSALAQKQSFATSKHAQLKGWFNREYIKTGKIEKNWGNFYTQAFDNRQKSDYTFTFKPDKEVLIENLRLAEEFIELIKGLL